ncbi:MAG: FAD-binding protein [Rhodanobacter sp.]
MRHAHLPIVVVGSGVAGLATALAAAPAPVRLLCRAYDGCGSASALAQGGVAAAVDVHDSPVAHAADTMVAGAQHNDATMVQWLTAEAPAAIAWLAEQGVAFDRHAKGNLLLGKEGGHSAARIVHAGGDATGAALVQALRAKSQAAAHVQWRGGVDVDGLLLRGGRVVGVRTHDERGRTEEMEASAVVLATGGIGALFARTSNPSGADGAGLALGLAAGAAARDLEFVQFHPTALDVPGQCLPLITEALRGAGAHLYDANGNALMAGVHPLGDLAPRDIVSRRVAEIQAVGGQVWLDATAVDGDWERRFPTVLASCLAHDFDPRRTAVPVTHVAHFHMGGLATDREGRTNVPGLYAVGEVACNGVYGANRLASNSLLEAVLCGRQLGKLLANMGEPVFRKSITRVVQRGDSMSPAQLEALRNLLWQAAGPLRDGVALRDAWRVCVALDKVGWQARLGKALLRAMRLRTGSLRAHSRHDLGCAA